MLSIVRSRGHDSQPSIKIDISHEVGRVTKVEVASTVMPKE